MTKTDARAVVQAFEKHPPKIAAQAKQNVDALIDDEDAIDSRTKELVEAIVKTASLRRKKDAGGH